MTHLLIVDDSEIDRRALKILLERNGYRVTAASSGEEALAAARRDRPDAVISDVMMRNMDGFVFCRTWMQDKKLRPIPFIFYTGHLTDQQDEHVGTALGAARYLIKPLETNALLLELGAVLQARTEQSRPQGQRAGPA